jgi:porin
LLYRSISAFCIGVLTTAPALCRAADCPDCDAPAAFAVSSSYTGEVWRQMSGGIAAGVRYLDNLDLTAILDGEQLLGLKGFDALARVLYSNGHVFSDELVGAAQGVSNIEASGAVRLYELWSEWRPGSADRSVRFGLYDLNSEFDSIETAALFLQPSQGIGADFAQSGANGPSVFPVTSLALRIEKSFGGLSLRAAVLDGVPGAHGDPDRSGIALSKREGALLVGEMNYGFAAGARVGAGHWQYTAAFDDLVATDAVGVPRQRHDNAGTYVLFESAPIFARSSEQGLRLFMRHGFAEPSVNAFERYYGGGVVYEGLLRHQDRLGIAVAVVEVGGPFRRAQEALGISTAQHEINCELTYRLDVTDWLALQPDVQYFRHPGMNPERDATWVFGIRFEVSR